MDIKKRNFIFNIPDETVRTVSSEEQLQNLMRAKNALLTADAVVIGGGSGLSSSCGYNHYHHTDFFEENFGDYEELYGFDNLFAGMNHVFSSPEEQWAFHARYIRCMNNEHPGEAYLRLKDILGNTPYFILTTNVDTQFSKAFPDDRIWTFQGDVRYLQCCQPCHDRLYDALTPAEDMVLETKNYRIPHELLPRCPECGRIMVPWVRDDAFLEGSDWHRQKEAYEAFLRQYRDKNIVFLELGVGDMTPAVIKFPFWEMTGSMEHATLISINSGKASAPEHIQKKSIPLTMDLTEALNRLNELL